MLLPENTEEVETPDMVFTVFPVNKAKFVDCKYPCALLLFVALVVQTAENAVADLQRSAVTVPDKVGAVCKTTLPVPVEDVVPVPPLATPNVPDNNNNASLPPSYSLPLLALDTRPVRAEIGWFDPLGISRVRGETSLNLYPLDTDTIGWMPCIKCAHCILGRCVGWRADRPARAMKPGITQVRTQDS
jgi:hypothetical protein